MIKISKPYIEQVGDKAYLKAIVTDSSNNTPRELWYAVDQKWGVYLCDEVADAFVVAMSLFAARQKKDIYVEAPLSVRLYYNLKNAVLPALGYLWGGVKECVTISCDSLISTHYNPSAVATGCSLGVDSFSAILNHLSDECPEEYRLTHLTNFNVGAFGNNNNEKNELSHRKELEAINRFANEIDLPVVSVNSNISEFYKDFLFNESHAIRNMSAVLSLQKLIKYYYYASGYSIEYLKLNKADTSYYEAFLLPQLSTDSTSLISEDVAKSRIEKTISIIDNSLVKKYLNVCIKEQIINDGGMRGARIISRVKKQNCTHCTKCLRTIAVIDALGKIKEYESIFDIEYYKKIRTAYLAYMMGHRNKDKFMDETYRYMKNNGINIPLCSYILFPFFYASSKLHYLDSFLIRLLGFI